MDLAAECVGTEYSGWGDEVREREEEWKKQWMGEEKNNPIVIENA